MSRIRMRQQPRSSMVGATARRSRRWPGTQIAAVVVSLLMALVCALVLYGPIRAGDTVHPVSFPYDQEVGLLGADALGRDVGQRLMAGGARLLVALPIGAVTTLCITVLSLLAVQRPRWRRVANRLSTSLLAIPAMVVVLAAASIFPAWIAVSAAMLLLGVPQGMLQLSAAAAPLTSAGFIESARVRGESTVAIALREMVPALFPLIVADAAVRCLAAMQLMVSVHILGLGPTAPTADWALMIRENLSGVMLNPAAVIAPTCAIVALLLVVVLFFDVLVNAVQPPTPRSAHAPQRRGTNTAATAAPDHGPAAAHQTAPSARIAVEQLRMAYPDSTPIEVQSLRVQPGEILGISGASGSGKSTLLSLLAACPAPALQVTGQVWLGGRRFPTDTHASEHSDRWWRRWRREHCGLVEQDAATTVDTARSQWSIIRDGRPRRAIDREAVHAVARSVRLDPEKFDSLARMSGGQCTRLALVRALAHAPEILVLDEPTTGLDAAAIDAVARVLEDAAARGVAIVLSSHDADFLRRVCDQVVVVEEQDTRTIIRPSTVAELPCGDTAEQEEHPPHAGNGSAEVSPRRDAGQGTVFQDHGGLSVQGMEVYTAKGKLLLHDVHFRVPAGSFTVLSGPSGCGKTTLIRYILGLLGPDPIRGECAYAAQDAAQALHPMFSLRHQIRRAAVCGGHPHPQAYADELLASVRLSAVADHKPAACSGGQRQRASIARALAAGRPILVVDEPTTGLDAQHATEVVDLLDQLAQQGTTVLAITHDPTVLHRADHVIDVSRWSVDS
ncbi:ATP-binding cassette domain-containing protein [Corynebacterium sp. TAE3-ERU30]|uniref:ATP-binding cassette domain-containing protein n=1 Tax=Corynebacterium sp. TAE3-ERU30 TaxID=2849496 RepID=UPI001C484E7F|nr:ATP-binding cassette domain-containing protein [Corynebacterium sp. TAE3-ERU30]MBV7281213.1 ATP-binding cassette domain-containing protein [Corynebacterium sp. TAE3-ERU30]